MASKLVLLPTLLLALAFVTLCAQSFVFGGRPVSTSSLRSTARAAVPEALELQTSMTTALEVSTPGWWANIVTVVVPCAILNYPYLQSEKRKYEEKMGIKKWGTDPQRVGSSLESFLSNEQTDPCWDLEPKIERDIFLKHPRVRNKNDFLGCVGCARTNLWTASAAQGKTMKTDHLLGWRHRRCWTVRSPAQCNWLRWGIRCWSLELWRVHCRHQGRVDRCEVQLIAWV